MILEINCSPHKEFDLRTLIQMLWDNSVVRANASISDILPNPKRISELYCERKISALIESYNKIGFYGVFVARESPTISGKYELVVGHHRLEAFKRFYGEDYFVTVEICRFSDEEMLNALIISNDSVFNGDI